MKKYASLMVLLLIVMTLAACQGETEEPLSEIEVLMLSEMRGSFDYFWNEANTDPNSVGYGLVRDRAPGNPNMSSIAAVGFALTAIPIGVEQGWISYEEGEARVLGTLQTMLGVSHRHGFFYRFLTLDQAIRSPNSEVSVIDTALLIAGVLTAAAYFDHDEIQSQAYTLYERIDWNWFVDPNRNMFYMGYYPERTPTFTGHWDFYAEQLIMYVLGAGAPNPAHRIDPEVYYSFIRSTRRYGGGEPFIHSWFGSLFTHQFSHAWVDFRYIEDREGVNWHENSIHATIANRQYAISQSVNFRTFGENAWGMTASDGPRGYDGYFGAKPSGFSNDAHRNDGTIPPAGAIGSIVFLPDEVKEAMRYFASIEGLTGDYGFQDSFNFEDDDPWIAPDVIGINKGISLVMLRNYKDAFIWELFMSIPYVQEGLERLEFNPLTP